MDLVLLALKRFMHEYIDLFLVGTSLFVVIYMYFKNNPLGHSRKFMVHRFVNWFALGMTYAFLYMGRYNLSVSKNALGDMMTKQDFGLIFGAGTITYGLSFLFTGPMVDRMGGRKGMLFAALGSSLANILMGFTVFYYLHGGRAINLTMTMIFLYSLNMFFQSYGAVSIIKVKAYWFHVRERGLFGAIFGTLISLGVYFAFDWGQAIADAMKLSPTVELNPIQRFMRAAFAVDMGRTDAYWFVFFIPAGLLLVWALIDAWLLKDSPAHANFGDFDPHDASSDDGEVDLAIGALLKRIFTNPILLTIALVEFTSGVLRNGIMQWYFVFAKEVPQEGAKFFLDNWGLLLCMTGIFGGFVAGMMSDKLFQSRRGPPAAILSGVMVLLTIGMALSLPDYPVALGTCAVAITLAVIGVHSIMSGTAAADFGGRKATATASGIVDGCVYLGSGLQSIALGYLTPISWSYWPLFLIPFAVMGTFFAWKIWHQLPEATRRYLKTVENIEVVEVTTSRGRKITVAKKSTTVTTEDV
jgi:OPA family glycerol-3-phosphate transporter-like MFS transporter